MNTTVQENRTLPSMNARSAALFVLLVVAAFLGNCFPLELFFDCDLLFGSIFVMLVLLRYGMTAGVTVSVIATLYTLIHWNHPWAIVIFTLEVFWVGWLHKRRNWDLLLADIIYWFTVGLLLVWLLYYNVMDFSVQSTMVVALKQGLNGIFNTLIALTLDLILRRSRLPSRQLPSFRQMIFIPMLLVVIVPSFGFLYFEIQRERDKELQIVRETTQRMSIRATDMVSLWVARNRQTIETLASLADDPATASRSQLQRYAENIHQINSQFQRIGVLDKEKVATAFSPAVLEDGSSGVGVSFAHRQFVRQLWNERHVFVTDFFMGNVGAPAPRLSIAVPLVEGGAVHGAVFGVLDISMLQEMLRKLIDKRHMNVTLLDRGTVVASTREGLAPLDRFYLPTEGRFQPLPGGIAQLIPDSQGGSNMNRWKRSYYVRETAIPAVNGWKIIVESSLQPPLEIIGGKTIRVLGTVAVMLLIIIAASRIFSSYLTNIFVQLEDMTRQLPERIIAGEKISWPPALIREVEGLTVNYQQMAKTLQHHVLQMESLTQSLEQRVEERTIDLRRSHDLLARISQQLPGFIYQFRLNSDGSSIPYASEAIAELFEVTPDEVRHDASLIFACLHPDDREEVLSSIRESAETLTQWQREFRVILAGQGLRWRHGTARPQRLEDNSIVWHGFVSDVTAQKEMEQQLQLLNDNLEQMVQAEVSKNREKDQLMIVQNRQAAMGEMIGNIAHQWRQPLNALALVLANITDAHTFGELNEASLQQLVSDGNRLIQKMSCTINDFRNFFKPDKERVSFSALSQINDAIQLIDSSFKNNSIEIRVHAPLDLELFGFPNEYSQVLLNLLSNAKEAILTQAKDHGTVEISLSEHLGKGCVTVRDNGGGIPDEIISRIFEPYFSTKEMGTGIGLYMSKMIIERGMSGTIEARNVDGGAEFSITTWLVAETGHGSGTDIERQTYQTRSTESEGGTVDAA